MLFELPAAYRRYWHYEKGGQSIGFRVAALPRATGQPPHGEDEDEPG